MIFIDTSYLVALAIPQDGLHRRTIAWSKAVRGQLLTTEFVLIEFVNSMSASALRPRAHSVVESLRANPFVRIEPASTELCRLGLDYHKRRPDKDWSLTDCTSFVTMTQSGSTAALTHDLHFEQAGFKALLRADPQG